MEDRGASDLEVVRAVQAGDVESFRVLVQRHEGRLRAVLLRLAGDPLVAEELAHETFVRAYRALAGFRGDARFGTWLVQIGLHLARDRARSRARHQIVSLDELRERSGEDRWAETRPGFDPSTRVEARELHERLDQEIARLPSAYREVFVLHQVEGMDYESIAQLTGDSVGALKVRAHRARKMLLESLAEKSRRSGNRRA